MPNWNRLTFCPRGRILFFSMGKVGRLPLKQAGIYSPPPALHFLADQHCVWHVHSCMCAGNATGLSCSKCLELLTVFRIENENIYIYKLLFKAPGLQAGFQSWALHPEITRTSPICRFSQASQPPIYPVTHDSISMMVWR